MTFTKRATATLIGSLASQAALEADVVGAEDFSAGPSLPFIGDLIEAAYPTWCIDENENRLADVETCKDGTPNGRWSPLYFTKQNSGADPALGGYPGNIDISYAFEFAAPFMGQACAGSPHFCNEDFDGSKTNCKKCPKLNTDDDNGPYGPGHVPPHISLAAVSWAYEEGGDIADWFDFESNACRILPHKLLEIIRIYYPRDKDGKVYYPPPFSEAGGAYPLEFVNLAGESCTKEGEKHATAGALDCFENHSGDVSLYPVYLEVGHGSPHYCTKEGIAADINPDYCPYIYFGPNRGKYRHPHIAFSAVEVYLSNLVMPEKCGTTWDDSNYPAKYDTTVAFPYMSDMDDNLGIQQPTIDDAGMWIWPGPDGPKRKPVKGTFALDLYTVPDSDTDHEEVEFGGGSKSIDGTVSELEDNGSSLPDISDLIEAAYPTWCMDENENRLTDVEICEDGTPNGRWSPLYFTKQYSGADPALGGYPSNIDINYAFEFAAPFMGQACAGSPHFCDEDFDGSTTNCKQCPKLNTDDDNGPYGPGHVPPHISLAAVSWAHRDGKGGDVADWFDFESSACRILPHKLLEIIRIYYPRDEDGKVYYPPPFSDAGGAYPLEFVNLAGESCTKEAEKHSTAGALDCFENHSGDVSLYLVYLEVGHGSPHYCTKEGIAADINPDYCPYIYFGPNRGKYRHPHIAFSAMEVYLSNLVMPEKCGTTWDDSNYPAKYDTTVAFPYMSDMDDNLGVQQPTIDDAGMWIWPGPDGHKKKPVQGKFALDLYTVPDGDGDKDEDRSDDLDEPVGGDESGDNEGRPSWSPEFICVFFDAMC